MCSMVLTTQSPVVRVESVTAATGWGLGSLVTAAGPHEPAPWRSPTVPTAARGWPAVSGRAARRANPSTGRSRFIGPADTRAVISPRPVAPPPHVASGSRSRCGDHPGPGRLHDGRRGQRLHAPQRGSCRQRRRCARRQRRRPDQGPGWAQSLATASGGVLSQATLTHSNLVMRCAGGWRYLGENVARRTVTGSGRRRRRPPPGPVHGLQRPSGQHRQHAVHPRRHRDRRRVHRDEVLGLEDHRAVRPGGHGGDADAAVGEPRVDDVGPMAAGGHELGLEGGDGVGDRAGDGAAGHVLAEVPPARRRAVARFECVRVAWLQTPPEAVARCWAHPWALVWAASLPASAAAPLAARSALRSVKALASSAVVMQPARTRVITANRDRQPEAT